MSFDFLIAGATVIQGNTQASPAVIKLDRPAKERAKPDCQLAWVEMQCAINRGEHSNAWRTVCDGCRQWVDGIWKITIDKKRICRKCSGE